MAELVYNEQGRLLFTEEMKREYTLLMPQMLPVHFTFLVLNYIKAFLVLIFKLQMTSIKLQKYLIHVKFNKLYFFFKNY